MRLHEGIELRGENGKENKHSVIGSNTYGAHELKCQMHVSRRLKSYLQFIYRPFVYVCVYVMCMVGWLRLFLLL